MSTKYIRQVLVQCLVSGIVLWILGCNAISSIKSAVTPNPNSLPIRSMDITMDLDQREEFFAQIQGFADQHSLELRSTFHDADKKSFIIVLDGDNFQISALSHLYTPREINIFFYNKASPPTSQEAFDVLYNDFKNFLKEVPNIQINEKLPSLRVTMDESQREKLFNELFTQLKDFADQHLLGFTVSSYDPNIHTFLVEMDGDGFQLTIDAVRNVPREMNIQFHIHYADNGEPTSISKKTIEELYDSLKSYFGELPNVTIEELK